MIEFDKSLIIVCVMLAVVLLVAGFLMSRTEQPKPTDNLDKIVIPDGTYTNKDSLLQRLVSKCFNIKNHVSATPGCVENEDGTRTLTLIPEYLAPEDR